MTRALPFFTSLFLAALFFAGVALAQGYPNRAVKVIVPWPPGQATDIAARVVAEKLQSALGLDEPFTWVQALGGALVIFGVMLVTLKRS